MKEKKICDCTGICGVQRSHEEIWRDFEAKHRSTPGLTPWDLQHIDARWRSLGKLAAKGRIKNATGV